MKNVLAVIGGYYVLRIVYLTGEIIGERKVAKQVAKSCRELKREIEKELERNESYAKA